MTRWSALTRKARTGRWVLIFRKNPQPSQMPKHVPKGVDTHMFGPDVLLAGWPEDPKPAPKPARKAHHASKK